jgi:hypothetical protein
METSVTGFVVSGVETLGSVCQIVIAVDTMGFICQITNGV